MGEQDIRRLLEIAFRGEVSSAYLDLFYALLDLTTYNDEAKHVLSNLLAEYEKKKNMVN